MSAAASVSIGDVMRLEVNWGAHSRNHCASCHRYMGSGAAPKCAHCQTGYLRVTQGVYEVVSRGT